MRALVLALGAALLLAGCGQKIDPKKIEGRWLAENYRFQGLKLPISPDLQISEKQLALGMGLEPLPLKGLEADGKEVTLLTEFGIDLVFSFENDDRIYFTVPVLGERIYYQRAKSVATASAPPSSAAVAAPAVNVAARAQAPAPAAAPVAAPLAAAAPSSAPQAATLSAAAPQSPAAPRSEAEQQYLQSLAAVRRGDKDEALRALSTALAQGFRDWPRIRQEPAFDALRQDVRYQVMESRWK